MVEIYREKGIDQADAKEIVHYLSKYKKAWVDVMMVEELGIVKEEESPINNALVTFFSFVIFGFIPLVANVLSRIVSILAWGR